MCPLFGLMEEMAEAVGGGSGIGGKKFQPPTRIAWENQMKGIPFHLRKMCGGVTAVDKKFREAEEGMEWAVDLFEWLPNRVPIGRGEMAPHEFQPIQKKMWRMKEKVKPFLVDEICVDVDHIPNVEVEKKENIQSGGVTSTNGRIVIADHSMVVGSAASSKVKRHQQQVVEYGWRWELKGHCHSGREDNQDEGKDENSYKKGLLDKAKMQRLAFMKRRKNANNTNGGRAMMGHQYEMAVIGASANEIKRN